MKGAITFFMLVLFLTACTPTPETQPIAYEPQSDFRSGKPVAESEKEP